MKTAEQKEKNKLFMREHRKKMRAKELETKGFCPHEGCGMSLRVEYQLWHAHCPYYKKLHGLL